MLKYFLNRNPWWFILFVMTGSALLSILLAGIATWVVYQKISWFIEIVALTIPVLVSPLLSIPAINFIKNYQREKENQRSILEIIQNIEDIFFIADINGKLVFVNQTMQDKLGFSKNELLGKNLLSIHPDSEIEKINKNINFLLEKNHYSCRTLLKKKDGTAIQVETSAKILQWNNEPVSVCVSRDITEQQSIIDKLRNSEIRFREFAEMLPELVCEADENGMITFANKNAIKRFGYSQEDIKLGINMLNLLIPEDRAKANQNIEKRLLQEFDSLIEYTALRKDNSTFPCLVILSPILENSKLKGFRGLMIDITEQKNKEAKLISTLNFANNLVENLPLGILIFNSKSECVSHNRIALEILALSHAELTEKSLSEVYPSLIKISEIVNNCASNKKLISKKVEIEQEFEDENIWLECTALPNSIDELQNVILIIDDITQRVKYEHELKKLNLEVSTQNMAYLAQNREIKQINNLLKENQNNLKLKTSELELLINKIKIQIWYLRSPYEYGIVNQAHADFLGKKIEDISYKPVAEVLQSSILGDAIKNSLDVYKTKTVLSKKIWTRDWRGDKKLLSILFSPSVNEKGEVDFIVCSALDITSEMLAEEKIKKNLLHQEYISTVANLFNSLEESSAIINKAIALTGNVIKSSRVYVSTTTNTEQNEYKFYEWLDKGVASHFNNTNEMLLNEARFFNNYLIENKGILSNNTETFENELRHYYQRRNIKSVIVFPIMVNNVFYGFVGIDDCKEIRTWEKLEIESLRILSNLLGNYLAKQEILEQLRLSEKSILEAKEIAEKANSLKSEFLANMSHEIRTPINAILGYAKLLSKSISDAEKKEHIEIIRESGKNLLALINDILDLSKIEAGKMKIEHKPLSLKKIINEIQNIFKLKAKEKGIEFIIEIDAELPDAIILDEIRLRQVLFNLVGNAIKFTQKGYIKLSVLVTSLNKQKNKINLSFTVEDTGIGIADDQVNEIFKSFKQQEGQSTKFEGTGLGLTITRKLVSMMDGIVTVSSKLGEGSQFTVELFEVETSKPVIAEEEIKEQSYDFLHSKVLLVEDNVNNQNLVKHFLNENNVLLYIANNGKEAIKFLESIMPDVILMDLQMPVMDGYEAAKIIKSKREWSHIPVIPMSAHVLPEEKERIKAIGATGFIPKPIDDVTLCSELAKHLKHNITSSPKNSKETSYKEIDPTPDLEKMGAKKHQVLLELFKTELDRQWEENLKSMQINKWKEFGFKIKEIGETYDSIKLIDYGNELINCIKNYNIKKLKHYIYLYEKISRGIKNFQYL